MAERRMFAKSIIDSDLFLDMPQSTQLLYFHLSMRADDDGFINNPKSITRNVKCNEDDLKLLTVKQFIIPFESGIIVIRHWKQHNYIQKDRYRPTTCRQEIEQLTLENGVYNLCIQSVSKVDTKCIQTGYNMDTQESLELVKDSTYEISKDISCAEPETDSTPSVIELILNDKTFYSVYQSDIDEWSECFPGVNVMQQLKNMRAWLDSNPTRRKTKRGVRKFITGWLMRENDRGARNCEASKETESTSSAKLW